MLWSLSSVYIALHQQSNDCLPVLSPFSRPVEVTSRAHFLTSRFLSPHQEPWRCRCRNFHHRHCPWIPSFCPGAFSALLLKFFFFSWYLPLVGGMKFAFEIKTKLATQATIIIGIVAFSSSLIATIAIYLGSAPAGIVCAIVLVVIVYLALQIAPR
jgi:hypothetical protein